MSEGRPTGIKLQDVETLAVVLFEGRHIQLRRKREDERGRIILELDDAEGALVALYGYFRGDEFMELDREPLY